MSDENGDQRRVGFMYAIGAVLGGGIGGAVGFAMDDLGTGVWIGSLIGMAPAMFMTLTRT